VNLASGDVGGRLVQQAGQQPDDTSLGLSAESEQDEVVPGKHSVDNLRDDGVLIADDPWKQRFAALELADQVVPQLVFDAAFGNKVFGESTLAQSAQSRGKVPRGIGHELRSRPMAIVALQAQKPPPVHSVQMQ